MISIRQYVMLLFLLLAATIFISCQPKGDEVKLSKGEWILIEKEEPTVYVRFKEIRSTKEMVIEFGNQREAVTSFLKVKEGDKLKYDFRSTQFDQYQRPAKVSTRTTHVKVLNLDESKAFINVLVLPSEDQ